MKQAGSFNDESLVNSRDSPGTSLGVCFGTSASPGADKLCYSFLHSPAMVEETTESMSNPLHMFSGLPKDKAPKT